MERSLTEVPAVDVETAEREISEDVNHENLYKVRFTSSFNYFATRTCTVYSSCI